MAVLEAAEAVGEAVVEVAAEAASGRAVLALVCDSEQAQLRGLRLLLSRASVRCPRS